MSKMQKIYIDDKYIVRDKSSSDGSQAKYYSDSKWYKIDYFGGEAESEYLASLLLACTDLDKESYVSYKKVLINGQVGCVSKDFRTNNEEEFVTFYRLYKNIYGRDLATVTSRMDYDDAITYVIGFVKKETGLDVTTYLANTFWLDSIILNTDRHFNNYGIIMSGEGYREAPIFDNGKSLLTGESIDLRGVSISDAVKKVYSKSFSSKHMLNYNLLKEHCTISLDKHKLLLALAEQENSLQKQVLEHQLEEGRGVT